MLELSEDLDLPDGGDGEPFLLVLQPDLLQRQQLCVPWYQMLTIKVVLDTDLAGYPANNFAVYRISG